MICSHHIFVGNHKSVFMKHLFISLLFAVVAVASANAETTFSAPIDTIDFIGGGSGWGGVLEAYLSASYERVSSLLAMMSMSLSLSSRTLDKWNIPSRTPAQAGTSTASSTRFQALIPSLSPVHPGSTPFLSFSPMVEVATGLLNYK